MYKILFVHNYYQQPGGEDSVFSAEMALLQDHGYNIIKYIDSNHRIGDLNSLDVAIQTIWSRQSYKKIYEVLVKEEPDLVHFHNIFPLISPAAYYACKKLKIPVIQSLDNPRLICPAATLYRKGKLCLDCLGKTPPYPGIIHGCYHNSRLQTAVIVTMLSVHRWMKTWQKQVDKYLVATEFYKKLFIKAGLPAEKIAVKPHFVRSNPRSDISQKLGEYVLYIGRLDPEKGIPTLLSAWKNLQIPLKIRGDGQLLQVCSDFIETNNLNFIEIIKRITPEELKLLISNARFLIWPSEGYYETFGMVAVECFSLRKPVVASDIGVMGEVVKNGESGLLFEPGNASDLASKVEWLWNHPEESKRMGINAYQEYEMKYTPQRNYQLLIDIYSSIISKNKRNG